MNTSRTTPLNRPCKACDGKKSRITARWTSSTPETEPDALVYARNILALYSGREIPSPASDGCTRKVTTNGEAFRQCADSLMIKYGIPKRVPEVTEPCESRAPELGDESLKQGALMVGTNART